jgi:hypothetical protein
MTHIISSFICVVLFVGHVVNGVSVRWERNGNATCVALNCSDDAVYQPNRPVLCSYHKGDHIPDISDPTGCVSASFPALDRLFSPEDLIRQLGPNGVLAFVGDSIVRSLFVTTLEFLGPIYSHWFHDIVNKSHSWAGAERTKIDHTYLCSPSLGPQNITISFFWRPYLGEQVVSRVPWVKQAGRFGKCVWWENGDAMRHCDGSNEAGATERWQGEDRLDEVQLPPLRINGSTILRPKREFVVISSAGVHNTHDSFNGNATTYVAIAEPIMRKYMKEMEDRRELWRIAPSGGRNIFFLPPRLQGGTRYSPVDKMNALDLSLEEFVRKPMRTKSNITCDGDFEVIDIVDVTDTTGSQLEPGTVGDGIHYPHIVNYVLIQLIAERLILFNSSNWRQSSSWDKSKSYMNNDCSP